MLTSFNTYVQVALLLSVVCLLCSLVPAWHTAKLVSAGPLRHIWFGVVISIVVFSIGTMSFLWINATEGENHHEDWLVALVFLLASSLILLFAKLSYATAFDIRKLADLEVVARLDPVTEIFNRRHIVSLLGAECARSRQTSPLSILLIDVDSFKKVNDTYGHHAGDVVLREIAQLISRNLLASQRVGRYGGEEFLVLLPEIGSLEAAHVAERLRTQVQSCAILYSGDPILSPTISIGVATAFGWRETPGQLIAIADEALYAAKSTGKNRVCHAFELSKKRELTNFAMITPPS